MDYIGILKQAAQTTWRHRSLWVLGFLWALVSGGTGFGSNFGNLGASWSGDLPMGAPEFTPWVVAALLLFLALLCVLIPVSIVLGYVLWAGIYRVLDAWYTRQVAPTVGAGFREGWHRRTWRLFLLTMVVYVPLILVFLITLLFAASPLLLLLTEARAAMFLGVFMALAFLIPTILLWVAVFIVVGVLAQFWSRAVVLEDYAVPAALRHGWELVRRRLREVAIMWLLMVGVGLFLGTVMFIISILAGGLAFVIAGGPAWLLSRWTGSALPALLWGIPVGLTVFLLPTWFAAGLLLIFDAAVWNQVYRAIGGGDAVMPTMASS
jgi:hypothetical protein